MFIVGVQLSTLDNPQSFQNFTAAVPFFQVTGAGAFCFPVDLQAAGINGVQDGTNVTLQFTFDGGDGELFQVCLPAFVIGFLCAHEPDHFRSRSVQT